MKLKDIKNSMMYKACKYKREAVLMQGYVNINSMDKVAPEKDAIEFYLAVQILGIIESKYGVVADLPPEIAELAQTHQNNIEQVFFRMFTYIMLISIGESRHGKISGKGESILKNFSLEIAEFAVDIKNNGRSESRHHFLNKNRDLLQYSEYCEWAFINCFSGGSYGGSKWKNIANKVTSVLNGEISPYTMVDISWALVHNTGSIFNKNTIYYNDAGDNLALLLDIQRGGGIASHVLNNNFSSFINSTHSKEYVIETNKADQLLDGALSVEVTPQDIKKAGALHYQFMNVSTEVQDVITNTSDSSNTGWEHKEYLDIGNYKLVVEKRSKK